MWNLSDFHSSAIVRRIRGTVAGVYALHIRRVLHIWRVYASHIGASFVPEGVEGRVDTFWHPFGSFVPEGSKAFWSLSEALLSVSIDTLPKYASIHPKCVVLNGLIVIVSNKKSNLLQHIMCDSAHVRSSLVGQYLSRFCFTCSKNWYVHKSSNSISIYFVILSYLCRLARIAGMVVLLPYITKYTGIFSRGSIKLRHSAVVRHLVLYLWRS